MKPINRIKHETNNIEYMNSKDIKWILFLIKKDLI
jgi:hypothetical protein